MKESFYVKDKLGLNWVYMKDKVLEFNESVDVQDDFEASSRWFFNVLKRSCIVGVNAHGGAGEKSDKDNRQIIYNWKQGFWGEIRKNKIP